MIELDHSTLPQPEPEPAVPILASHLLRLEEKQRTRFSRDGRPERLSTHCEDIDEILGGGVERGIVMGVSGEGTEGRLISLHLLASVLLAHLSPNSTQSKSPVSTIATIVDTTGSFPLPLLAKVLKSRITTSHALATRSAIQTANHPISRPDQPDRDPEAVAKIEEEVQKCLEMVAISRVFDIEGLWEVLGEINHENPTLPNPDQKTNLESKQRSDGPIQSSPDWPEFEITDSQESESLSPAKHQPQNEKDTGTEIIIIDTLSSLITELFSRKEKSGAHELLTSLSTQIHILTTQKNVLTLLHNTTTPSKPSYPQNHQQQKQKQKSNQQPTSLFPSNPLKPALGSLFSQFPSLHIFLSHLPKTREDAELLYGRDAEDPPLLPGEVGYCVVVEVLRDEVPNPGKDKERKRFGWREGGWCAVDTSHNGEVLKGAFDMRGGMRGMGLERRGILKPRTEMGSTETEVGNVAKIYGFGGRRV